VRRHLGLGFWSLSAYLKYRVKSAVAFIGAFEEAVATEARHRGVDGVICGHIHHASDRTFAGVHYLNCGDWVESCTAVAESHDGELRVVHWRDRTPTRTLQAEPHALVPGPPVSALLSPSAPARP
jgi:UDP-2,3-diacylglucosamine pyrophosphatase LpxH